MAGVRDSQGEGIRQMLADLSFPAPAWQVIAHAHSWGADAASVEQLGRLPVRVYTGPDEVLRALGRNPTSTPAADPAPARAPLDTLPVPDLTKAAQHKAVGAGLAVALLALDVEAVTINRHLVESAFERAWRDWPYSSRFPQVRADADRNDIVAILRSSARRKGPHIAIWSTLGEYTPELCGNQPLSRAGSSIGRPAGVTHRQWLELGNAFATHLNPDAGEIRFRR